MHTSGPLLALMSHGGTIHVLVRFTESVRVRLWGRQIHSFRKGEVHRVSMAIAAVLLAQGCAKPVEQPPALPQACAA